MITEFTFKNQLILAMPTLTDPNFERTVTLICEHNSEGAMGVVINRPSVVSVAEILRQSQVEVPPTLSEHIMAFEGGPVQQDHGFVIHTPVGEWASSMRVSDDIALTTSRDILVALNSDRAPHRYLVAMGYAGWGAGQLENELIENAWLTAPATTDLIFETPFHEMRAAAAATIGIDMSRLASGFGHA
ncbi:MAG: YqgE/AlgH family protein [Gammaproteobacteria bacterium]|nr:YqgE/AlgH family protein [Gammaproteobacteria bacterium]